MKVANMMSNPNLMTPSPEGETVCRELWEQWLQAYQRLYQKLPRAHRSLDVVYYTFLLALSDDEIGERISVSREQVQVLRARGMAQVRQDTDLRAVTQDLIENCF
jgi:DNA-directed RNA polymerase specialized sigma24 family protein